MVRNLRNGKNFEFPLLINGSQWTVRLTNRIPRSARDKHPLLGLCDSDLKRIYVRVTLPPFLKFQTLIHELLHAFEFELKIDFDHALVYALERPILEFMRRNYGATLLKALNPKRRLTA